MPHRCRRLTASALSTTTPGDRWTLHAGDRALLGNRSGATRLGFAVLLKVFQADGRFPCRPEDVPLAAVEAVASQIRAALGLREATDDDAAALGGWLGQQVLALERRHDRLVAAARERCRALKLEPPSPDRLDRLVRSALHRQEETFCAAVLARLTARTVADLDSLLRPPVPDGAENHAADSLGTPPLLALRAGTGQASLKSVDEEAAKLQRIRALALPPDLFDGVPARVLLACRRRVGAEELYELRRYPARAAPCAT